jgi:hypothetical protein
MPLLLPLSLSRYARQEQPQPRQSRATFVAPMEGGFGMRPPSSTFTPFNAAEVEAAVNAVPPVGVQFQALTYPRIHTQAHAHPHTLSLMRKHTPPPQAPYQREFKVELRTRTGPMENAPFIEHAIYAYDILFNGLHHRQLLVSAQRILVGTAGKNLRRLVREKLCLNTQDYIILLNNDKTLAFYLPRPIDTSMRMRVIHVMTKEINRIYSLPRVMADLAAAEQATSETQAESTAAEQVQ